MKYAVEVAGRLIEVELDGDKVQVDGRAVDASLGGVQGNAARRLVRGERTRPFLQTPQDKSSYSLSTAGHRLEAQVLDPRQRAARQAGGAGPSPVRSGVLKAPMPGRVVRVLTEAGAQVTPGQPLVVVEAMKMENELKAPLSGSVTRVLVAPGDKVEKGSTLLEIDGTGP